MTAEHSHLDTSVFGAAINQQHRNHNESYQLLEVCLPSCIWCVPDLAIAEATFREYIEKWEMAASSRGVLIVHTKTTNSPAHIRKALVAVGLQSKDIRHVLGAMANQCATIVSADEDFVNPKAKAMKRRKKGPISPCRDLLKILTAEAVSILMPTEALSRYCDCS